MNPKVLRAFCGMESRKTSKTGCFCDFTHNCTFCVVFYVVQSLYTSGTKRERQFVYQPMITFKMGNTRQSNRADDDRLDAANSDVAKRKQIEVCLACAVDMLPRRIFIECGVPESKPITASDTCVVYYCRNFAERGFADQTEADLWLQDTPLWYFGSLVTNEGQGWRGPVPIVSRAQSDPFPGPFIKDISAPYYKSGTDLVGECLNDLLGDETFNPVLEAAQELGFDSSLSPEQMRRVIERAHRFSIPGIDCRLANEWLSGSIFGAARSRLYHSATTIAETPMEHLRLAVLELEDCLIRAIRDLTVADVYNFWTSLQTHRHFQKLTSRIRERYSPGINDHVLFSILMRWIGSYAAQFR
jgi:hypothetical protein